MQRERRFGRLMGKVTDDNIKEMETLFKKDLSVKNISEKLNIDRHIVSKHLRSLGYKTNKLLAIDETIKLDIINKYKTHSASQLSNIYGYSKSSISKIWRENGLVGKTKNVYLFNENYFNVIDSNNKAYILGFIMSDGCVYTRKNNNGNSQSWLRISIHEKDIDVLEFIKQELESNHPIKTNFNGTTKTITLTIVSDTLCSDLRDKGVVENKTWKNSFDIVSVPNDHRLSYLIGYFDGDGCISNYNTNYIYKFEISIVGILYNLEILKNILDVHDIKCSIKKDARENHYKHDFYSLNVQSNTTWKYCFSKLYTNEDCYHMNRKYDNFVRLINLIESNASNRSENITAIKYYEEEFNK